jgi:hypothetical protein
MPGVARYPVLDKVVLVTGPLGGSADTVRGVNETAKAGLRI